MENKFTKKILLNKSINMNKLFYTIFLAVLFWGCEQTTKNLGQTFTPEHPIALNEVLNRLNMTTPINDIQIEGKIEKSCMSEGCWFTIKDSSGTEITFDVQDKKFKVPTNSSGKTVIVLADAALDSTSEQKVSLSVKGMMFK